MLYISQESSLQLCLPCVGYFDDGASQGNWFSVDSSKGDVRGVAKLYNLRGHPRIQQEHLPIGASEQGVFAIFLDGLAQAAQ